MAIGDGANDIPMVQEAGLGSPTEPSRRWRPSLMQGSTTMDLTHCFGRREFRAATDRSLARLDWETGLGRKPEQAADAAPRLSNGPACKRTTAPAGI
jgi:hypothetical protein